MTIKKANQKTRRNSVRVNLYSGTYMSLEEVNQLVNSISEEYKNSIVLEAETIYCYDDDGSPQIVIYYDRLETDAEQTNRLEKQSEQEKEHEARELKQLKDLQKKYKGRV